MKPSGSYTISVGAGGAGGAAGLAAPNGGNSSAFNWIAMGGGAGGSPRSSAPLSYILIYCLGNYSFNGNAGGLSLLVWKPVLFSCCLASVNQSFANFKICCLQILRGIVKWAVVCLQAEPSK